MSLRLSLSPSFSPALLPIGPCSDRSTLCGLEPGCAPIPVARGDDIKLYYTMPTLPVSGSSTFYTIALCPIDSTVHLPVAIGSFEVRSFGGYLTANIPSVAPYGVFRFCFLSFPGGVLSGCTPPIQIVADKCFTSLVEFGACESILGYNYYQWPVSYPRFQRARVRAYLDDEQFSEDSDVYYGSNGGVFKTYARVRRNFTFISNWAPTYVQEWIKLGLAHDYFVVQDERFGTLQVVSEEGLQLERPKKYPPVNMARGTAKVVQHGYNKYNNFCASCL